MYRVYRKLWSFFFSLRLMRRPLENVDRDSRRFLSSWGAMGAALGGCCFTSYDSTGNAEWELEFDMYFVLDSEAQGQFRCVLLCFALVVMRF